MKHLHSTYIWGITKSITKDSKLKDNNKENYMNDTNQKTTTTQELWYNSSKLADVNISIREDLGYESIIFNIPKSLLKTKLEKSSLFSYFLKGEWFTFFIPNKHIISENDKFIRIEMPSFQTIALFFKTEEIDKETGYNIQDKRLLSVKTFTNILQQIFTKINNKPKVE